MKTHTSMKQIVNRYDVILSTGYGNLQHLLAYKNATYYNAGIYGWNCDIYTFWHNGKSIALTTGYRNMRGNSLDYDTVVQYDKKAQSILSWDNKAPYEEKESQLNTLLKEFLEYCIEA